MKIIKWVGGIIAILVLIIIIIYGIGMALPEEHTASKAKTYSVAPDKIWKVLKNYENYSGWRSHVDKVEIIDSVTWREYYSYGDMLTFRQLEMDSLQYLKTEIADENIPFGGYWEYKLQSGDNSKTTLTIVEHGVVYDPFFRFINTVFMDQTATMETFMNDLESMMDN